MYRVLVGKPEGKRPLGRPRRRWVDNIRMDLQEVGCGYVDWIGLAQDRDRWRTLVSAVMNLGVPWNAGNFLTSCKPVSFSRRTLHNGVSKLQVMEHFWYFIQIQSWLQRVQHFTINSYRKQHKSNPYLIRCSYYARFQLFLPSDPKFSKQLLLLKLLHKML